MPSKTLLPYMLIALLALVLSGCFGGPNLFELASDPWDYGFCYLVVLILNVIAIIELVGQNRSTASKALWILLIVLLPVLGLILYYLIARKK